MAVPKIETWIPDKVPLTWIEKVILACIDVILTDEPIQHYQVNEWAHRNLKWVPV